MGHRRHQQEREAAMPVDPDTIPKILLFSTLEPSLLARIAAISTSIRATLGDRLFDMGEHPACLYIVQSVQVALGRPGVDGEFVAVEVLRAGEFFGTPAVLIERPS